MKRDPQSVMRHSCTGRRFAAWARAGAGAGDHPQPKIDAEAVEADGKAIRLIAAAGMGVPLHFLSEGESATRATAAEMGDPTFRHFRRRQRAMCALMARLLTVAYRRAVQIGKARPLDDLELRVEAPEIVVSDNESLGRAVRTTVEGLRAMHAAGWVDNQTAAALALASAELAGARSPSGRGPG